MAYKQRSPIILSEGGTGATSFTDHGMVLGQGVAALTATAAGTDGQVIIAATGGDPAFATLASAGGTIAFTTGANTLNLETGGAIPTTFTTDAGNATPAVGVINILGGTNVNTAGAAANVTINLDGAITVTSVATDDAAAGVTLSGNSLVADGTDGNIDIDITPKGTGTVNISDLTLTGATPYAIATYGASSEFTEVGPLTDGQLLIGSTGVDAVAASLTSTGSTIGITGGAGSIDLDVAAAVPTSFLADDANSAVPAANVLTVAGGNNVSTTAAASTLTISLTDTTQYALQVGDASGSLDSLAVGTANQILQSGGAGANPAWSTATYPATTSQGDILYSSSDNTLASLAKDTNATRYLSNTGASNNPAWAQVNVTNGVTGTLPVGNGGTGVADPTDHSLLVGSGAAAMTELGVATDGQLIIGSSAADPVLATLTAGAGISVTNAAGSITIATSGGGMAWEEVTDATKSMAVNYAYGANRGAGVTFTLPATAAVGTRLEIVGIAGNWVLAQNAGQTVYIGDDNTTTGAGGSLTATDAGDCIELVCIVADTDFRVKSAMGNITVV